MDFNIPPKLEPAQKKTLCELNEAARVLTGQYTDQRASQCDVDSVGPSIHWLCPECFGLVEYAKSPFLTRCADHAKVMPADELEGLKLYPNFVSAAEEDALVAFLDGGCRDRFEGWKESQSGRRKQDYGPQPNFKKKKVKLREDLPGVPVEMKSLTEAVEKVLTDETNSQDPYTVAQISALEYLPQNGSFLNPHIDDTWLWGDRVVGVSLLSDSRMTFVTKSLSVVDVPLPRRAMFLLSGASRYVALHGIRSENVTERRISITIRELSKGWLADTDEETIAEIKSLFTKWL